MIKPEIIRRRLEKLEQYLQILKSLQRYSEVELFDSPERYGSAERFLHLAIEALNDIGNHIVAGENLGAVDTYSDIPRCLERGGIISRELLEVWMKMIGFRNILVHGYTDIDRQTVFDVLQNHVRDLEKIGEVFSRRL